MHRLYFTLSIVVLVSLLAGCAPSAAVQPQEVKALENPTATDLPEKFVPADSAQSETVPHNPPASCPITRPPNVLFVPPAPYPPERYVNEFWYGTPELWTMLGTEATWYALQHNKNGYTQKIFWWSQDFNVNIDPYPPFTLIIERLDADAPLSPVVVSGEATNASADFGTAMLTGVDIPELGCWKITGQYQDAEMSFVVWVAP